MKIFIIYLIILLLHFITITIIYKNYIKKTNIFTNYKGIIYNVLILLLPIFVKNKHNKEPISNIQVLIHYKNNFKGFFGHTDIIINDKVYSYGNYNKDSYKIFDSYGEGILFITNKDEYIKYCLNNKKKIYIFNIHNNKEIIINNINNVMKTVKEITNINTNSYINKLNQNNNIKFYKFNNIQKKYYFLGYNCVFFVKEILNIKTNIYNIETPSNLYFYLLKNKT